MDVSISSSDNASQTLHHGLVDAPAEPKLLAVVGWTAIGTLTGACAAALFLAREWSYDGLDLPLPITLLLYALDAALVVTCALVVLHLRFRSVPDIRTGVMWVGLGLVAGGLWSLAPAIAFAGSTGYSSQPSIQGAEVTIVAACCLVGVVAGAQLWLSLRRISA